MNDWMGLQTIVRCIIYLAAIISVKDLSVQTVTSYHSEIYFKFLTLLYWKIKGEFLLILLQIST